MSDFLQIHIVQMTSTDSVEANIRQALELLKPLQKVSPESGVAAEQLICFPENSLYMRIREGEPIPGLSLKDSQWQPLQNRARELRATMHFGSVPLRGENKLTNSSVTIASDGSLQATYTKVHLFDIDIEGHRPVRESDVFEHGEDTAILQVADWRFGQSICYDLRFSELYSRYARAEVDGILVPSAFLVPTGQAHWEILLRARAVESQAYLLAAAQAGIHQTANGAERRTYGHSLLVDPWGRVLADGGAHQPGVLSARLSRTEIDKVRRQIPMRQHRRLD